MMDQMWRVSARVYAPPFCGRFQKNDAGGTSWRATPVEMHAYDVARKGYDRYQHPRKQAIPIAPTRASVGDFSQCHWDR